MEQLIHKLRQHNIDIEVSEGKINLKIPQGLQADDLIREIKANKESLIAYIGASREQEGFRPLSPVAPGEDYGLSSAQKRLYFLQELDPDSIAFNMPQTKRFRQRLDPKTVVRSFQELITRHESLRTSFHLVKGEPRQRIQETVDFEIDYRDGNEADAENYIAAFFQPFALGQAPLLRVGLLNLPPQEAGAPAESILLVDMHHIISDRMSNAILIQDILQIYAGNDLPPLRLQYKDYAAWQQTEIHSRGISPHRDFWHQLFEEELSPLELPTDFARPLIKSNAGRQMQFFIGQAATEGLRRIAQQEGITMFIVLLSVIKLLLYKLSHQKDIVVGSLTSGRFHPDLEGIIGMFVNTVPLRSVIDPELRYLDFLRGLQGRTQDCFAHQAYPYEALVDDLFTVRDPGRNPLFDVMFSFFAPDQGDAHHLPLSTDDAQTILDSEEHNRSMVDLYFSAAVGKKQIALEIDYATDLFETQTIRRFVAYFQQLIAAIVADPRQPLHALKLISPAEKQQILKEFNATHRDLDRQRLFAQLFAEQVAEHPTRTAVVHNDTALSYQELSEKSIRLAAYFQHLGIGRNDKLLIYLPRSIDTLSCILATFQAGAAYVPIDIHFPLKRVEAIIRDCAPKVILTNLDLARELSQIDASLLEAVMLITVEDHDPGTHALRPIETDEADLAYLIYTSGSTGKPKGVMIHQLGMVNHLFAKIHDLDIDESSVVAQTASVSFDISVWQFLVALLKGGQVHILDREKLFTAESLLPALNVGGITIYESVPSLMTSFLDGLENLPSYSLPTLKWMLATGEALSMHLAQKWYRYFPEIRLLNAYGPTEASDDITHHLVANDASLRAVPVGKPIQNTHIYILDDYLNLCPVGVKGEICVSGIGVGLGYWKNAEKTREVFVPNPLAPKLDDPDYGQLYKTGDLGYFLPDGTVICLGRKDEQVKILGNRIELGEIADRLRLHPAISEAVVLARGKQADAYLVAYYVAEQELDLQDLRYHLLEQLPDYMVPHYFGHLTQLPVTTSGKLNPKALPEPTVLTEQEYVAPVTEIERVLVGIWAEVLHLQPEQISVTGNFFVLGGHSLRAIFMVNKIVEQLHVQVPLKSIFVNQDIRSLGGAIEALAANATTKPKRATGIQPAEKREYYPLSSAQLRIYLNQKMMKDSHITHMYSEYALPKTLDKPQLTALFRQIIARHESLRTSFQTIDNIPVQVVHDQVSFEVIEIPWEQWRSQSFHFDRTIDLSRAPLFKVGLVVKADSHLMIVDMHHIISDGISDAILYNEFLQLARGEVLPPLERQYKDYAVWQHKKQTSDSLKAQEAYWLDVFSGALPKLHLPGDRLQADPLSQRGDSLVFHLGRDLYEGLKGLAQSQAVPFFSVLIAIQTIVLHKLSNQDDLIIGITSAGRNHPTLEPIIGVFLNTFALRLRPAPAKRVIQFITEVADHLTTALDHQDYQFDELMDKLKLKRESWKNPLFNVIMVMQNYHDGAEMQMELPDHSDLVSAESGIYIINDLFFTLTETAGNVLVNIQYNSGLYTRDFISRLFALVKETAHTILLNPQTDIRQIHLTHALQEAATMQLDDGFDF